MRQMTQDQKIIFQMQLSAARKNPSTALILSLFALSRFHLGQVGLGLLQWFMIWLYGIGTIWAVVDVVTAKSRAEQYNAGKARRIAVVVTGNPAMASLELEPPKPLLAEFNELPILARVIIASLLGFAVFAFYKARGL
jgi:TM2 domain-containing membrane protein YozV